MKILVSAVLFVFSSSALARAQAIFAEDSGKATILLISLFPGDEDASGLFNAMTVPVEVTDGKPTRKMNFDDSAGQPARRPHFISPNRRNFRA